MPAQAKNEAALPPSFRSNQVEGTSSKALTTERRPNAPKIFLAFVGFNHRADLANQGAEVAIV